MILQQGKSRATFIVIFGYLAATLTGFIRQSALAYQMGAGRETDIFLVAFAIPELAFIALPIIVSPVVIPLLSRIRQEKGERTARSLTLRLFGWLSAALVVGMALAWLLAPVYTPWLAVGFTPGEQSISLILTRQMLAAIFFMGVSALTGAVLQVYRSFARPAIVTTVYNLVFVAGLFCLPMAQTLERAVGSVILGSAAAFLVQMPELGRLLFSRRAQGAEGPVEIPVRWNDAARLLVPFACGYGIHHLILLVDRAMATTLSPGDAAAISYARNLSLVIVQVSGLSISTVMFPALAEQIQQRQLERARDNLTGALLWVWAVAAPLAAGMVAVREPLVRFLLERGAFDRSATATVSLLLVAYSASALADALCQPLWRVIYAQSHSWEVFWINGAQTALRILLNFLWIGSMGVVGLTLSAAVGLTVQLFVLAWLSAARLEIHFQKTGLQKALHVLMAAVLVGILAALTLALMPASASAMVQLAAAGAAGAVAYVGIMLLFGDVRSIWRGINSI